MKEIEKLHFSLLNVGLSVHNGNWNWKGVSSPFARLFYIKEGSAEVNLPEGIQKLKPNYLYLIPPFILHSYTCEAYFSHYYIHIYEEQSVLEELKFPVEVKADSLDLYLIERLLEINPSRELTQYDPDTYDNPPMLLRNIAENAQYPDNVLLETNGILLQLFSRFLKYAITKTEDRDERIAKVLHYIRKHINEPIKVSQLSDICHLSDDHFIRVFKKEMQCTPIQYLNKKKIEKAQLMLNVENISVKDIAYSLSFDNLSYFNRLFKQLTQYTPREYAKIVKGNA